MFAQLLQDRARPVCGGCRIHSCHNDGFNTFRSLNGLLDLKCLSSLTDLKDLSSLRRSTSDHSQSHKAASKAYAAASSTPDSPGLRFLSGSEVDSEAASARDTMSDVIIIGMLTKLVKALNQPPPTLEPGSLPQHDPVLP